MIWRAAGPIHGGSSVESGFGPGTLRPQSRGLTTRPPRPSNKTDDKGKESKVVSEAKPGIAGIRAVDAAAYRRRIEAETTAQSQARRERYAEAHHLVRNRQSQRIRDEAIHFIEAQVEKHNCGPMNIICQFRKSKNFAAERPSGGKFTSCFRKEKIKLEKPSDALSNDFLYPNFLLDLLTNPNNPDYKTFHDNIRSYNSAVSFALMGTKVFDFSGGAPYAFKVYGQIRRRTSHIQSVNGQAPQYVQLYVIDSTQATKFRVNHPANEKCNLRILYQIDLFFRQHNRLSDTYRILREAESRVIAESKEAGEDAIGAIDIQTSEGSMHRQPTR
ncbi:hypothetical protein AVEN_166295-1 [Araneus ventricosus]|uniref:Helitron helicase-like domain-containing protein n=1 Tax=Araneus ventricosus TaxID=182803 RepID=A0A4Y2WDD8_ARAVE|nr:hypothetical protein AVEN_166295-1 [Araneus ventricosus]